MSKIADNFETHVVIESPKDSPVDLLQRATGLSRQRIKLAMTHGAVWLTRGRKTQRLRRVKRVLRVGDELHLYYDARNSSGDTGRANANSGPVVGIRCGTSRMACDRRVRSGATTAP